MKEKSGFKGNPSFQIKEYVYREYVLDPDFPIGAFVQENYKFSLESEVITYLHFHNCMEIMYCYDARIVNIENRIYYLEPGSVCVIPQNMMHNSKRNEVIPEDLNSPCAEYLFLDPAVLLGDFFTEVYSFQSVYDQISREVKNVITERENSKLCKIVRMILKEMRSKCPDHDMVKGLFLIFWIELTRTLNLTSGGRMSKRRELTEVYPAMVYIREHYKEKIDTAVLADQCHMSVSQFRKNFKKCVGISSGEYARNRRLAMACQMLLETEIGILDVAMLCGFTSVAAFNSCFIAKYGISVSKWKKENCSIKKKVYSHRVYRSDNNESKK